MKIVHTCLCGAMTDGLNYQENILTKYHRRMGCEVTIIASQCQWSNEGKKTLTDRTNYRNSDDVKVIRLPVKIGNVYGRLKVYSGLYQTVESEQPDILFIHGNQFLDIITLTRYVKKHTNVQVYVDNHVDYINGAHGWLSKNILHKGLWRFCAHRIEPYVTKFYGVLPARVDFLKELYHLPEEKCELLVMGGDDERIQHAAQPQMREDLRAQYGIAKDDFLIMTGGKINAYRPQTLSLLEAVGRMQREHVKLILFGSVSDELKAKVESLTDGKTIQNIGWVQAEDTYKYFAAADLVVFPGGHSVFWEQVAAQGIPMLVKDWKGMHHVDLGGNVRFLKESTVEEIQLAIEDLVEHPEKYQQMKAVAVEKGMKEFSYVRIAERAIACK